MSAKKQSCVTSFASGTNLTSGNIRELQNFIERSLILTNDRELRAPIAELTNLEARDGVVRTLNDAHRALIIKTLRETDWVVGGPYGAAAKLGLNPHHDNAEARNFDGTG